MINSQDRAKLRALSNGLKDLVFIGKGGVTDNVVGQINDNLFAHELIKIKTQKNAPDSLQALANEVCTKCDCELVAITGNKIIVYKFSDKPKIVHLL